MIPTERLDVFKGVHKGLRKALFELALQVGTLDSSNPDEVASMIRNAGEVFHFLKHHSLNEDRFLIPEMETKSMAEAARMMEEHGELEAELGDLRRRMEDLAGSGSGAQGFYLALNHFVAGYLLYIHDEETGILPRLHERLSDTELAGFPRNSVAATEPRDQEMMLAHMFPAMTIAEIRMFFGEMSGRGPVEAMRFLEAIAARVLGDRAKFILDIV